AKALERQEEIARSQILQNRADSVTNLAVLISSAQENVELVTKLKSSKEIGPKDLSPEENTRAYLILTALRSNLENTYLQYTRGYLPDDFYKSAGVKNNKDWGALLIKFGMPLTEDFKMELERIIAAEDNLESTT
ncbi:MAG: hypothetical protein KUG50_03945, partial [Cycloclasticus sp.]|nr:hypothetical protein [Cycloclasticus sp.]